MKENIKWTVTPEEGEERLDLHILRRFPASLRSLVQDAIRAGQALVNGGPVRKGMKLEAGDEVHVIRLLEAADLKVQPDPALTLNIVHEDADLLILDKPPGMPVHPLKPLETGTLANALVARYPSLAGVGDDPLFPALVHRIDTDTSGLVAAARTNAAYTFLREEFRRRHVRKEYVALVRGVVGGPGRLDDFLAHDPARRGRMRIVEENGTSRRLRPMRAVTEYRPSQRFREYTLLDVTIRTGVTHQIRAQLAAAGHPIVADRVYGGGRARGELGLERHFLHASGLEIAHPRTGQRIRFRSPLPADLRAALEALGRAGTQ
ncbi:MAG: RluA family pseudouridine synthase [Kiritimatiellae bacterium]|nr:RluA family pseudouridine synthase [Kiritimatiellia bacterium]